MEHPAVEIDWRRRGRLTAERRAHLKAEMVPLVAAGLSTKAIASELGVHYHTVTRWRSEMAKPGSGGFRPIEIAASHGMGAPVLVTPTGVRVEGLSLEQIALLLRSLR